MTRKITQQHHFNPVRIIERKRDNFTLTQAEIAWFINEYSANRIPDYQMSAFMMAVYFNGLSDEETTWLTEAMAQSGDILDLGELTPISVDKHSSGGVGDKTSFVVAPIAASAGLVVPKMSGRGLGITGGTLDKLEAIPGFRFDFSGDEFIGYCREHGMVLAGQSARMAPADGKMYALRDVTATVDAINLIAASIMSKKLAGGAAHIVLDVKTGCGAFMRDLDAAKHLSALMVAIGSAQGRNMTALMTDMDQPLGCACGNAIEIQEAVETLQGRGPVDFTQHCILVSAHMFLLAGKVKTVAEGKILAKEQIQNGKAWAKFRELIIAQGGDVRYIDMPDTWLPKPAVTHAIVAPADGWVKTVNALGVGLAVVSLGGGRRLKTDTIDHAVGVLVHVKVGDKVVAGQPVLTVLANDAGRLAAALADLENAVIFSESHVSPNPHVLAVVSTNNMANRMPQ